MPPVTTPPLLIDAVPAGDMLHTPDGVASDNAVVWPWHTCSTPPIGCGTGFTVATAALKQPEPKVYVIFVVPAAMP